MLIISLVLVLSLFLGSSSSSKLENPGCRIIRDKYDRQNLASRNYLADANSRWPNNKVPYVISRSYNRKYVRLLLKSMRAIESISCVKWIPRTNQKAFVHIKPDEKGCFANMGYSARRGKHILNLQTQDERSTCMIQGIAMHEMLHILGAGHEQCRPDRDAYVSVNWNNVPRDKYSNYFKSIGPKTSTSGIPICDPDKRMNFNQCWSGYRTSTFGLPYDYQSLMHYGLDDFTLTGGATMIVKQRVPYGIKIGQRIGMTKLDVYKLNAAYKCNQKPLPSPPPTKKTTRKSTRVTRGPFTFGPTTSLCWDKEPEWCDKYSAYCLIGFFVMKDDCQLTCGYCKE